MKKIIQIFLSSAIYFFIIYSTVYAQNVGINATGAAPHTSAMLDILSSNKGLLIPRVTLTGTGDVATIPTPTLSLLVYNRTAAGTAPNNVLPGFYYWNGTKWILLSGGTGGNDWSLLGNAGTSATTNFLGTTDNVALNFRVNNNKAGIIDPAGPTFFGYQAGNSNTDGSNTGIGYNALYSNTSGFYNTATGYNALYSNDVGTQNVATGYNALYSNIQGFNNTATGYKALYSNTFGNNNTATGSQALANNIAGGGNTATGANALYSNTDGSNNTATGLNALYTNTSGIRNTATGNNALYANTTGSYNIGTGSNALYANTIGSYNVATGYNALYANITGISNVATGSQALYSNTIGNNNVAFGSDALYFNTTGNNNTIAGYQAVYGVSGFSHSNNSVFGYQAGYGLSTGSNNIFVGYRAGDAITTGSNNIVIGYDIDAPSPTGNNQLTLGNLIFGTGIDGTGTTVSTGNIGIGINNPTFKLHVNGTTACTGNVWTSDARKKKDIQPLTLNALSIISLLKPVTFEWKDVLDAGMKGAQMGFIAQDLEKVLPGMVLTGSDTDQSKVVKYNELLPVFTKAIQEQQIQMEQLSNTQKKEHEVLKKRNELLRNDLDQLKKQHEEILKALHKTN